MKQLKYMYSKLSAKRVISDEKGMTMLEVLTALVLLTMIIMLLSSFLFMGISMYKRVTATNQIRNQGDALISQVISYFKDVEYVSDLGTNRINIVRRAYDADGVMDSGKYIENFIMSVEPDENGILVSNSDGTPLKRFDLTTPYRLRMHDPLLDPLAFEIKADSKNNLVELHLVYEKVLANPDPSNAALVENPTFEINTQIPLFRSE